MFPAYLSDVEAQELGRTLQAVLLPYFKNKPSPERRRYILGLTSLPDVVGTPLPAESQTGAPPVTASDAPEE